MTSIANYMNDLDESFPSIDTIAADAYLSPRQVIDCIPKLERLGELAVLRGQGVPGRGGRTNLYRFPLMPPSKRALKSHEKSARLSTPAPAAPAARGQGESSADSAPLPNLKATQFPVARGEKSRLETSHDPLGTFSGTEKQQPPISPAGGNPDFSKGSETPKPLPLPEWLPKAAWGRYLEMRCSMRDRPATSGVLQQLIRKLDELRGEGHDPELVLNQSVRGGWSELYPVHADRADSRGGKNGTRSEHLTSSGGLKGRPGKYANLKPDATG